MRVRFFPKKPAELLVEGLEWRRNFVRRTTHHDLLEVNGDSDTSWAEPGHSQKLNSAVVDEFVNLFELPITVLR